jgi:CheY-like chemotaxis protein
VNDDQKRHVLVVEDEAMVSMLIEDMVLNLGGQVVGPAAKFEKALSLAREAKIDVAVLDINLAGTLTYPIAKVLKERGIPFVFATGYNEIGLPMDFQGHLVLEKPFSQSDFDQAVSAASPS